jgi:hypothetical protein
MGFQEFAQSLQGVSFGTREWIEHFMRGCTLMQSINLCFVHDAGLGGARRRSPMIQYGASHTVSGFRRTVVLDVPFGTTLNTSEVDTDGEHVQHRRVVIAVGFLIGLSDGVTTRCVQKWSFWHCVFNL